MDQVGREGGRSRPQKEKRIHGKLPSALTTSWFWQYSGTPRITAGTTPQERRSVHISSKKQGQANHKSRCQSRQRQII
eukprot:4666389-Prorocentrum_lima.AAC.1